MLNWEKYVVSSLELHLFFARVMKEHVIFLEAGFTPKNTKLSKEAEHHKAEFENFLCDVVKVSHGVIRDKTLCSGEFITEYTLKAEEKTQHFTGICINQKITIMQSKLDCKRKRDINKGLEKCVKELNKKAMRLIDCLIEFKEKVLRDVLCCKIATTNYPSFIEHTIEEAKEYRCHIMNLDNSYSSHDEDIKEEQVFWNEIMMEHGLFIRGLLDPYECDLIEKADQFARDYAELLEKAKCMTKELEDALTKETLKETIEFRKFKESGVKGIEACEIKSVILPLLADHVLREANHYIRILKSYKDSKC